VLTGVISPIFLTFILVLANRRSLLGDAANRRWFRVVAAACVGLAASLAMVVVVTTVSGWL
jgi:Mn2+/Fe2+ NRAMP family transporter